MSKRKQSLSGYIREHLTELEQRMEAGYSQESIIEGLKEAGFETSIGSLRTMLYRARRRATARGILSSTPSSAPVPAAPPRPAPPSPENPLRKPKGFEYGGTANVDPKDLF